MFCSFETNNPFNLNNERSWDNTSNFEFNCGGYAFGTFSWYEPHPDKTERCDYGFQNAYYRLQKRRWVIKNILQDFANVRIIHSIKDLHPNEYAVAARMSDTDFHFMRRDCADCWSHKRGNHPALWTATDKEVLHSREWIGGYYGKVMLFAVNRVQSRVSEN